MSLPAPGQGHDHGPHDHGPHGHDRGGSLKGLIGHLLRPHSHDAADSALESSAQGIRAVTNSLIALGVTAVAQVLVVVISGSVALLADTIHNFSDALTAIPALAGLRRGLPRAHPPVHVRLRPRGGTWPACS